MLDCPQGAVVHYRVTSGEVRPTVDTTDSHGITTFVWSTTSSGEIFGCVEASDGCTEMRILGVQF